MFYGWKPYVPVAQRRKQAQRYAAGLNKKGEKLLPVSAGRKIANTFWGKAWCDNLEHYSDYENRLPRGRTYLRNGSVIDLKIAAGQVSARVMGSDLYTIKVNIAAVPKQRWQDIGRDCAGSIDSLIELLQGRFSKGVMERVCRSGEGLFPSPKEIKFDCSCPDWAAMCKHVAAVFYGVGARLDEQPELLFALRGVDAKDLVARAGEGLSVPKRKPAAGKVLEDTGLAGIFGIEIADAAPMDTPTVVTAPRKKRPAAKKPAKHTKKAVAGKKKVRTAKHA